MKISLLGLRRSGTIAALMIFSPAATLATDYYVSPTGSDSGDGSINHPWATVAKVDNSTFAPGDSILFQRGATWHENLTVTSSGTVAQPITYGAYGSGAAPTFTGADAISGGWTNVAGSTYSIPYATPVNALIENGLFTHNANLVTGSSDAATNISYVQSHTNTNFYDPVAQKLYVNSGSNPNTDHNQYAAGVRQDVVYTNLQSNITVQDLSVTYSGAFGHGYSFWAQFGSNIKFLNDTSYGAGKHDFAAIESQGFLGQNLKASYSLPDQGFGGASAYVAYDNADQGLQNLNTTWLNDSATNANGAYPAFLEHGSIGKTVITGMLADNRAISISGDTTLTKSTIINSNLAIYGNSSLVDGLKITGASGAINLYAGASDNIIQNTLVAGNLSDYWKGQNGAISDAGSNNTIRFNTVVLDPTTIRGADIGIVSSSSNDSVYGNILEGNWGVQLFTAGNGQLNINHNLYFNNNGVSSLPTFFLDPAATATLAQWQVMGYDVNSLTSDPVFVNAAMSDYELGAGSPAIDAFLASYTADGLPSTDLLGNPRPAGGPYDLGAYELPEPSGALSLLALGATVAIGRRPRRHAIVSFPVA